MRTSESCLRNLCGLAPLREVLVLSIAAQSVFFVTWFRCGSKSLTTEERRNTEEPEHQGNDMITKDPMPKYENLSILSKYTLCGLAPLREVLVLSIAARSVYVVSLWFQIINHRGHRAITHYFRTAAGAGIMVPEEGP